MMPRTVLPIYGILSTEVGETSSFLLGTDSGFPGLKGVVAIATASS